MSSYSKRERVDAALSGETPDRVPVSAWRHFIPAEQNPDTLARASLDHFTTFDWDWLKVNPRATYYEEAWGSRFDYGDYDKDVGVLPRKIESPIKTLDDVGAIKPVSPTAGVFAEQLELIRLIKAGIGGAHFVQTVFTPLSVLASLIAPRKEPGASLQDSVQANHDRLHQLLREQPEAAHAALSAIASTLAGFSSTVVDAGASGIFFAIVQLARKGVLSEEEYATFGRPYDLQVLQAVQGAPFNLLHICGAKSYFKSVTDYPVRAINWASVGHDNPSISQAASLTRQALVGGVDEHETLQYGTPQQVIAQAHEAITATHGKHFLLTPGCAVNQAIPEANLHALRRAADSSNA